MGTYQTDTHATFAEVGPWIRVHDLIHGTVKGGHPIAPRSAQQVNIILTMDFQVHKWGLTRNVHAPGHHKWTDVPRLLGGRRPNLPGDRLTYAYARTHRHGPSGHPMIHLTEHARRGTVRGSDDPGSSIMRQTSRRKSARIGEKHT